MKIKRMLWLTCSLFIPFLSAQERNDHGHVVLNLSMFTFGILLKEKLSQYINYYLGESLTPLDAETRAQFTSRLAKECSASARLSLCNLIYDVTDAYLQQPYSKKLEEQYVADIKYLLHKEFETMLAEGAYTSKDEIQTVKRAFDKTFQKIMDEITAMLARISDVRTMITKTIKKTIERSSSTLASQAVKERLKIEEPQDVTPYFQSFTAGSRVGAMATLSPAALGLNVHVFPPLYDINRPWLYQTFHTTAIVENLLGKEFINDATGYYDQIDQLAWQVQLMVAGMTIAAPLAYAVGYATNSLTKLGFNMGAKLLSILLFYTNLQLPESQILMLANIAAQKALSTFMDEIVSNLLEDKIIQKLVKQGKIDYPDEKKLRTDVSWWSRLIGLYNGGAFGDQKTFLLRMARAMGYIN